MAVLPLFALGLGSVAAPPYRTPRCVCVGTPNASPATMALNDTIPRLVAPPAMETRLYVGMWTSHLRNLRRGMEANSLLGIAYRGFYGATFINSFGDRAIAAGVQRTLAPANPDSSPMAALGFRAGFLTGYDERFIAIAGKTPVLPFVQLVGILQQQRLGVEVAYSGVVASLMLSCRL